MQVAEPSPVGQIKKQLQQLVFLPASKTCRNPYSKSVFKQLADCRTANTGMHLMRCDHAECAHRQYQYHNCGNRHCPGCGGMKRQQWLENKLTELLPTTYFHTVFTLPHELNGIIMGNRKVLFDLLFEASGYTLLQLAKDEKWMGAIPGIISVLHTWGQTLSFHPHVHCIVSGGGIKQAAGGLSWVKEKRKSGSYLFPRTAMQKIYKAYFLKQLRKMLEAGSIRVSDKDKAALLLHEIGFKQWNVYAKRPFGGPLQVMEYLGRYTHKVAITAHRIKAIEEQSRKIVFAYKDYHKRGTKEQEQEMELSIAEFIRRFEQHILPKRFIKIRHYGYLSNHNRSKRLKEIFTALKLGLPPAKVHVPVAVRLLESFGIDIGKCPKCEKGRMEIVATYRKGILVKTYEDNPSCPKTIRNKDPVKIVPPIKP